MLDTVDWVHPRRRLYCREWSIERECNKRACAKDLSCGERGSWARREASEGKESRVNAKSDVLRESVGCWRVKTEEGFTRAVVFSDSPVVRPTLACPHSYSDSPVVRPTLACPHSYSAVPQVLQRCWHGRQAGRFNTQRSAQVRDNVLL